MAKSIVATFESRAEAERAAELLEDIGIERDEIEIQSGSWTGTGDRAERSQSWWEWLFGSSEDRGYYTDELSRGGAILTVTASDERAERVRDFLEAHGAEVDETSAAGPEPMTERTETAAQSRAAMPDETETARARARDEQVIPIVEERLKVGKRPVTRGGVRVYSRAGERPVEERITLREEHVRVERRPVDRAASQDDEAFRDREIEVTAMAEEAVVAKEARVVEEVAIGKEVGERTETVRDNVRRSDVQVENLGADRERFLDRNEADFRRHWSTSENRGLPYEQCRSAYGYGRDLSSDPRYAGRDWAAIESDARRDWEQQHPGTWQQFQEPIQYSWDRAREETTRRAA